jgi:hypothetical protein
VRKLQECRFCHFSSSSSILQVFNLVRFLLTPRPCASRFILQKFKRQMGVLNAYFETLRKGTKGRLNRVLVITDPSASSEALVRMLDSYYSKDETQEKYLDTRLPHFKILDTAISTEPQFTGWKPDWMEYTTVGFNDNVPQWIGLTYDHGKILYTTLDNSGTPLESALNPFATDSKGEASSILRSRIISSFAKEWNYDVVLYPDTATKIASKVLALTSQGRGYTLPWECGSLIKMPNGFATS